MAREQDQVVATVTAVIDRLSRQAGKRHTAA
jgi:hypothetical protein